MRHRYILEEARGMRWQERGEGELGEPIADSGNKMRGMSWQNSREAVGKGFRGGVNSEEGNWKRASPSKASILHLLFSQFFFVTQYMMLQLSCIYCSDELLNMPKILVELWIKTACLFNEL